MCVTLWKLDLRAGRIYVKIIKKFALASLMSPVIGPVIVRTKLKLCQEIN